MHPDISEFSFGYALTEALVAAAAAPIRAAPVFPSLIDEGKKGGGYDVMIPFSGAPLFLQFKLSHHMVRDTALEAQAGILVTPFYRMHLRPTRHSQQHPMLIDLEATGGAVFYAAPRFHTPTELNDAYVSREILRRSIFVKPSTIGPLPDDDDHHLAFRDGSPTYFCSGEPQRIRPPNAEEREFFIPLAHGFSDRAQLIPTAEGFREWNEKLLDIVKRHRHQMKWVSDESLAALQQRDPLAVFSYIARAYFGCNVIIVAPKGPRKREV